MLSSADDPPLIDDVTLLPSSLSVAPELESSEVEKKGGRTSSEVESWAVGDAVCWPKGDDELPNDAIGRVLRLHDGNCTPPCLVDTIQISMRWIITLMVALLLTLFVLCVPWGQMVTWRSSSQPPEEIARSSLLRRQRSNECLKCRSVNMFIGFRFKCWFFYFLLLNCVRIF